MLFIIFVEYFTAWKVSVFGVFLVCIFPHSDWIWRNTPYPSVFFIQCLSKPISWQNSQRKNDMCTRYFYLTIAPLCTISWKKGNEKFRNFIFFDSFNLGFQLDIKTDIWISINSCCYLVYRLFFKWFCLRQTWC